ncbi:MAG: hypothetical protein HYW48_07610 [Deltaproteobacteria bacterium]|nr:hypothetical protein [Deltaproteobacteria bacterium]
MTLNENNYASSYLSFGQRQAGVSLVFSPEEQKFFYNAYCVEAKLLKELFSVEYEFLEDALETINQEFGQWELVEFEAKKKTCGDCAAKR